MSVGDRLREERKRLGVSQAQFAASAEVAKNTLINWEKGSSSPTAAALLLLQAGGADATYILSGRRADERRADAMQDIRDDLADVRRDLLEYAHDDDSGDIGALLKSSENALRAILAHDAPLLTPELVAETQNLLGLVADPEKLRAFRITEHSAQRARRDQAKRRLAEWFNGQEYRPGPGAMNALLSISHEYDVPPRVLVELVEELHLDIGDQAADEAESEARAAQRFAPER